MSTNRKPVRRILFQNANHANQERTVAYCSTVLGACYPLLKDCC